MSEERGRRKKEGLSRIESELDLRTARHQDIRDFDRAARSTTAQSLFVSYPLPFLLLLLLAGLPGAPRPASPRDSPCLSSSASVSRHHRSLRFFAPIASASMSLLSTVSSLCAPCPSTWTHRARGEGGGGHPPPPSRRVHHGARLRRLLPFAPPLSRPDHLGPLGFTWRALMTSRNERVLPPSNKRLFHVPMLIPRESRRF